MAYSECIRREMPEWVSDVLQEEEWSIQSLHLSPWNLYIHPAWGQLYPLHWVRVMRLDDNLHRQVKPFYLNRVIKIRDKEPSCYRVSVIEPKPASHPISNGYISRRISNT